MAAGTEAAMLICNNRALAPLTNTNQKQKQRQQQAPPAKKKRNLPGTPDPEAEVIALSPRALLATNRFVCEICGKGFQRDQNLQLHRRGHNLPWKLRQRSGKEPRKRVYVCPEKSCVHHNPRRALGDLTGIKKHFCRKHGEKKWKCDKCNKRYAVQSDWKAHSKTCGTREYRCDCGTLFSRRDSFITHRAFCDALAEEAARLISHNHLLPAASTPPPPPANTSNISSLMMPPPYTVLAGGGGGEAPPLLPWQAQAQQQLGMGWINNNGMMMSLSSITTKEKEKELPSLFSSQQHQHARPVADMSATALLQKAAQIGAITSSSSSVAGVGSCLFEPSGASSHHAASLKHHQQDAVGREETRDFLGVAALCSPSLPLHGWI